MKFFGTSKSQPRRNEFFLFLNLFRYLRRPRRRCCCCCCDDCCCGGIWSDGIDGAPYRKFGPLNNAPSRGVVTAYPVKRRPFSVNWPNDTSVHATGERDLLFSTQKNSEFKIYIIFIYHAVYAQIRVWWVNSITIVNETPARKLPDYMTYVYLPR